MMFNELVIRDENYKQTDLGLIPTTWEINRLDNLTEIITDGSHFSPAESKDTKYKIATVRNMLNDKFDVENLVSISRDDFNNLKKNNCSPRKGDILLSKDGTIGKSFVFNQEEEIVLLSSIAIIRPKPEKINSFFISQFLKNPYTLNRIMGMKSGSAIKRIVLKDIKGLNVVVPPLLEQQKIAEILLAADQQIEDTDKLIEKSKKLKKGLMQRLFTVGTGHSKLKDISIGEIPESWKIAVLADISNFITKGSTPTTYGYNWQDEGIFFFKSDVVKAGKFVYGDFKFIDEEAHRQMLRSQIQAGDILMSITGNIGRVAVVPKEIKRANINQHVARIRVESSDVNPLFVFYWLSQPKFIEYYNSIKTGLAYPQISLKQVRETIIPIPEMQEQQKIVDILLSADEQIEFYEKEKEKQVELKKALMQQLLTGQLRVTV